MFKNFFTNLIYRKEKSPKSKYRWAVFCIIVLAAAIGGYASPDYCNGIIKKINSKFSLNISEIASKPFHLGLDLQGGTHLVYEADVAAVADLDKEKGLALEGARDVIERRVNAFGIAEPIIQTNRSGGNWRLIVELAGVKDVNQAVAMIGETPILEFKEENTEPPRELTEEEQKEMKEFNRLALEKAEDIISRLDNEKDFSELAKEFSEDPGSGQNGGELGFAKRGMMVPEFEKAIFEDLQIGETTEEPIKTVFGYHIIKKEEMRGGIQPDGTDNTEVRSAHILIRTKSEIDFVPPVEQWVNTGLSGQQLEKSMVEFDPSTNEP
ncbi:peptidylprolyl isomerase, partial [Candidatus Parcubacteria bacterium]|nr:peptidylprolyl isomerase [Candidatus Parcubacteria bacterium]